MKWKSASLALLVLSLGLVLAACGEPSPPAEPPPQSPGACGDGICQGPENPQNCPQDCRPQATSTDVQDSGPAVLFLGIMVHLEGWHDAVDQVRYERHIQLVREYADLFESHGAVLTLETKDVTYGTLAWGDNVLLEMEERGHAIGVHADTGGQQDYDCGRFAADLRQERLRLESLGVTVRHISGNASHCDWVTASIEAGYAFTTGVVAYHTTSLPVEARPEEFRSCETPTDCHQVFPVDLADRLHPWRAKDGSDWTTHDPNGRMVIIPSSGVFPCLYDDTMTSESLTTCEFTSEDVDAFFAELEQALTMMSEDEVNTYYIAWSLGGVLDEELLTSWLERLQPYVDSGKVVWMSLPEMYNAYLVWEEAH